jgi:hypothetical protein
MKKIITIITFLATLTAFSQDLEEMLDELPQASQNAIGTFKSAYILNSRSTENIRKGELEFRVHHRFGTIEGGTYELFGLDESSSFIALDYGILDFFNVGVGRATIDKCWEGNIKLSILKQKTGKNWNMPISMTYVSEIAYKDKKIHESNPYDDFENRMFYTHQLLIARKFNKNLSLQLMPTLVHRNLVESYNDNDLYAIGTGGRYKLTNWVTIIGEYHYLVNRDKLAGEDTRDSWSLGVNIDTGGHIFQLMLSNSAYLLPHQYLARSMGNFEDGTVHLGFNIMRQFSLFD